METILNIYLLVDDNLVTGLRAKKYFINGDDDSKIKFLMDCAEKDYPEAEVFTSPIDNDGKAMKYKTFSKMERKGMHSVLFAEIFEAYNTPENPLICVTPVIDGKIKTNR